MPTVLLIEDDAENRKRIALLFAHHDWDVLEAGGDDYLVKPLTWKKLAGAIKRPRRPRRKLTPQQSRALKVHPPSTRIKFWGVRGSIPVPGPSTIGYGGNTTCVEVRTDGDIIILDAGSGIRELGLALEQEFGGAPINLTLLLTHTHWDHIQGLPFFLPAYQAKNTISVFGYQGARDGLATILAAQMELPFFPVSWKNLPGTIKVRELKKMEFNVGKVLVS